MAEAANRKLVALVPMRHHSSRVPGKNYRLLAGRPLYEYVLHNLSRCPELEAIVVDTDSEQIREGVAKAFPGVRLIERPQHLRDEMLSINDVLLHDIEQVPAQFYLQTHSTNPLLKPSTIQAAIAAFFEAYPEHDSLFSVTRMHSRLWDAAGQPINHDPSILLRTQDLEPVFEENSCLYIFDRQGILERRNRIGNKPLMHEIDPVDAWDIDEERDFAVAETLIARST